MTSILGSQSTNKKNLHHHKTPIIFVPIHKKKNCSTKHTYTLRVRGAFYSNQSHKHLQPLSRHDRSLISSSTTRINPDISAKSLAFLLLLLPSPPFSPSINQRTRSHRRRLGCCRRAALAALAPHCAPDVPGTRNAERGSQLLLYHCYVHRLCAISSRVFLSAPLPRGSSMIDRRACFRECATLSLFRRLVFFFLWSTRKFHLEESVSIWRRVD